MRSPLASSIGLMQGELECRNHTSGCRTRIPSWFHMWPIGASGVFYRCTTYDDDLGKTPYSVDGVRLAGLRWIHRKGETLRLVNSQTLTNSTVRPLRGSGMCNDQAIQLRYTVRLAASRMRRLKESRVRGKPFAYRHEHTYRRVSGSQEANTPAVSR